MHLIWVYTVCKGLSVQILRVLWDIVSECAFVFSSDLVDRSYEKPWLTHSKKPKARDTEKIEGTTRAGTFIFSDTGKPGEGVVYLTSPGCPTAIGL